MMILKHLTIEEENIQITVIGTGLWKRNIKDLVNCLKELKELKDEINKNIEVYVIDVDSNNLNNLRRLGIDLLRHREVYI